MGVNKKTYKIVLELEEWIYQKLEEIAKEEHKTIEQVTIECIEGSM
jgi:hypothetical protein